MQPNLNDTQQMQAWIQYINEQLAQLQQVVAELQQQLKSK